MFVEIHLIQNFAPSCLNRDESNSPKDCMFGGYRRARISSQCIKRSMRTQIFPKILSLENFGSRTLKAIEMIQKELISKDKDEKESFIVSKNVLEIFGLKIDKKGKTSVLLFLGHEEIKKIAEMCEKYWSFLNSESLDKKKKEFKEIKKYATEILNGQKASDIALFGRMIAEMPKHNIDAASQVAHAISTHRTATEFDFFTALDEEKTSEEPGAGMMGTVEFNSACFYRYANINFDQLYKNLQNDMDLTKLTVKAFIEASVKMIPTGKQNSMAAQNPPSFVMVVLRDDNMWSLANAFAKPIPQERGDLINDSISALLEYWKELVGFYGMDEVRKISILSKKKEIGDLKDNVVDSLPLLINDIISNISI